MAASCTNKIMTDGFSVSKECLLFPERDTEDSSITNANSSGAGMSCECGVLCRGGGTGDGSGGGLGGIFQSHRK